MKNTLSNVCMFAAGVAVGYFATRKFIEAKYDRLYHEEITSYKETMERLEEGKDEPTPTPTSKSNVVIAPEVTTKDVGIYTDIVQGENYTNYAMTEESDMRKVKKPYVIPPDEFGELADQGYETESLTYYADGVLTDDHDEPIEDVDHVVGIESLSHFGEYEDDSVFVRNELYTTDYEILLDPRNYADVMNKNPHQAEDE